MPYTIRATTSGKQDALALPKRLTEEHPEFAAGRFTAHVVAPGSMLIVTDQPVQHAADEEDPILSSYLRYLVEQMRENPNHLSAFTRADVEGFDELLGGVESDRDADFTGFQLP